MKRTSFLLLLLLAITGCSQAGHPPAAENVQIEGLPSIGNTLSVSYAFSDPDGDAEKGTEIVWKSGDEVLAQGASLEIAPELDGHPIQVWVLPRDARGQAGEAVAAENGPMVAGYGLLPDAVPYLQPFVPPTCDPDDPEVFFIRSAEDWDHVNDADKRIFCVAPGDYGDLGAIVLTQSGTAEAPRYLLLDTDDPRHPAAIVDGDFADKTGWEEKLARYRLELDNADYWVIDRQAFWEAPSPFEAPLKLFGSSHNLINRAFYVDTSNGVELKNGSNYNTLQNIHMEKTGWAVDYALEHGADPDYEEQIFADLAALALGGSEPGDSFVGNVFVNNEVINYVDAFQTVRGSNAWPDDDDPDAENPPLDGAGTVIAGNLFYTTPLIYTDGSGNFSEDGDYALSENALDFKFGSLDPENPILVLGNVMFGYRETDNTYSDLDDYGNAMVFHFGVGNLVLERNLVVDSQSGYSIGGPLGGDPAIYDTAFRNNVFYNIQDNIQYIYGSGQAGVYDGAQNLLLEGNLFGLQTHGPYSLHAYNTSNLVIRKNIFADSRSLWFGDPSDPDHTNDSTGLVIEENDVYDNPDWFDSIPDYAKARDNHELTGPFDYSTYRREVILRKFTREPQSQTLP
ncbi:hypothetical protein [Oceanithermus sp.]